MVLDIKIPASEVALNFPNGLSNEAFAELCLANKELLIEREADGTITVMPPVSFTSGDHEADFIADLKTYARKHGGKALSSATGFTLPDTSIKSPDASYVSQEKVEAVTKDQLRRFPPIVPDFIVEVISPSDDITAAKTKMNEVWIANGVRLAWLVDVDREKLWIYRENGEVTLIHPFEQTITGEDVLPGFSFDLQNLM